MSAAALLRADLDHAPVASRCLDHRPALDNIVRDRLLAIDVLAGGARGDEDIRMPVIGCRHDDSVDIATVQDPAKIALESDIFGRSAGTAQVCQRILEM